MVHGSTVSTMGVTLALVQGEGAGAGRGAGAAPLSRVRAIVCIRARARGAARNELGPRPTAAPSAPLTTTPQPLTPPVSSPPTHPAHLGAGGGGGAARDWGVGARGNLARRGGGAAGHQRPRRGSMMCQVCTGAVPRASRPGPPRTWRRRVGVPSSGFCTARIG